MPFQKKKTKKYTHFRVEKPKHRETVSFLHFFEPFLVYVTCERVNARVRVRACVCTSVYLCVRLVSALCFRHCFHLCALRSVGRLVSDGFSSSRLAHNFNVLCLTADR